MTVIVMPVRGPIGSGYGPRGGSFHAGVDFPAAYGTPIYAAADGVIVQGAERAPGSVSGFGNWVWQDSQRECGKDFIYGHSRHADILVRSGDRVRAGQVIARVGSEGQSSGPHLHFEVWGSPGRTGGRHEDPAVFLRAAAATAPAPAARPAPAPQTKGDRQLIADVTKLSSNDSGKRDPDTCTHICVHTNEGPAMGSLDGLLGWLANRTSQASYHLVVHGDGRIGRSNDDNYIPWAAGPKSNRFGLHVCAMGAAAEPRGAWLARPAQLDSLATVFADWSVRYFMPLVRIDAAGLRANREGVTGHGDTAQAWGETNHTDPGAGFPFDVVLQLARDKINKEDGLNPTEADRIIKHLTDFMTGFMTPVAQDVKDIRHQLTGSRDTVYRDPERKVVDVRLSYPGFPQLGQHPDGANRTVVDGLAAVLDRPAVA